MQSRKRRGSARQGQGAMKSRLVLVTAPAVVVMGATLKKSRHSARPLSKCSSGAAAAASSSSSNAPESAVCGRQWMRVGQAGRQVGSTGKPLAEVHLVSQGVQHASSSSGTPATKAATAQQQQT